MKRWIAAAAAAVVVMNLASLPEARAESPRVRLTAPYGIIHLPTHVVVERKLIEKHAVQAGLGAVQVSINTVASPTVANDLLLSGNVEVAGAGATAFLVLWDKTRGPQKVRGLVATANSPIYLLTTDPRIKGVGDYTANDRIATTAINGTAAIMIQMKLAKDFGWEQRTRLNPLMVVMSAPDGMNSMLSGREIKSHSTVMPYNIQEMAAGAREILNSDDVLGERTNSTLVFTTQKFYAENPKLSKAIVAAYEEAVTFIKANKRQAAEIYVKLQPQPGGAEPILRMIDDEKLIEYTTTPTSFGKFADFMLRAELIRTKPASWKDFFFETAHDKKGS